MFTKNYWNILSSFALGGGPEKTLITTDGTEKTLGEKYCITTPFANTVLQVSDRYSVHPGGVIFGDGATLPTVNDYKLSGKIISGLSGGRSVISSKDDTGINQAFTFTLTNTNATEVTIREAGFIQSSSMSSTYLSNDSATGLTNTSLGLGGAFLINRIVLDEPVIIPSGGVGQVTLKLRFEIPT